MKLKHIKKPEPGTPSVGVIMGTVCDGDIVVVQLVNWKGNRRMGYWCTQCWRTWTRGEMAIILGSRKRLGGKNTAVAA